jgi:hypothetical protein
LNVATYPKAPTDAEIVPPVIAVAITAFRYLNGGVVVVTGAKTVDAVVVLTAEPKLYHETESKLPCSWTEPAETPALEDTTITEVVLVDKPSKTVGVAEVADCATRDASGVMP